MPAGNCASKPPARDLPHLSPRRPRSARPSHGPHQDHRHLSSSRHRLASLVARRTIVFAPLSVSSSFPPSLPPPSGSATTSSPSAPTFSTTIAISSPRTPTPASPRLTSISILADTIRDGLWIGNHHLSTGAPRYPRPLFLIGPSRFATPSFPRSSSGSPAMPLFSPTTTTSSPVTTWLSRSRSPCLSRRSSLTLDLRPPRTLAQLSLPASSRPLASPPVLALLHHLRRPPDPALRPHSRLRLHQRRRSDPARSSAADAAHNPLLLSISGSQLSLMTGLPSICDDFGTTASRRSASRPIIPAGSSPGTKSKTTRWTPSPPCTISSASPHSPPWTIPSATSSSSTASTLPLPANPSRTAANQTRPVCFAPPSAGQPRRPRSSTERRTHTSIRNH